ncbi:MAG: phosphotransferase family protein [Blastocatellia bacterium]
MNQIDNDIVSFVAKKNRLSGPLEGTRFSTGQINRVYNLANKYVLKIEGDPWIGPGHEILKPTVGITAKLLEKGARVPKILDSDTVNGQRYILMEKIRGSDLSNDWMLLSQKRKEKIVEQLATELQIWHSISFEEYAIPIVAFRPFDNLRFAIERLFEKQMNALSPDKLPKEVLSYVTILERFYYDHIGDLDETGTAVLCHTDIHLENILYEEGELTAIIDLDWAAQAPKDYDLWKIADTFHRPKYTVEERLEPLYGDYQMIDELNWLKKYYPKLFDVNNLADRVRLYYVDVLIEILIEYANGKWTAKALDKVAEKIRDFFLNPWLDKALSL